MKFLMLESFFFITLGISCILLLMLIYHFKGRLNQMETNQQTLFEVVNNIVQELTEIKRITINNASNMSYNNVQEKINVDFDDDNDVPDLIVNENMVMQHGDEESDSEDEEYSDDSDLESEDENSDEDEDEDENSDEVKVVSVDIDDSLDEIEQQDESNGLEELDNQLISSIQEQEENLEEVDINTQEIDNIKVSKLEETSVLEESDNVSLSSSVSKSVYKKMNVASLKALVIEKGLSTDPGKMKKNELIDLLDSNA